MVNKIPILNNQSHTYVWNFSQPKQSIKCLSQSHVNNIFVIGTYWLKSLFLLAIALEILHNFPRGFPICLILREHCVGYIPTDIYLPENVQNSSQKFFFKSSWNICINISVKSPKYTFLRELFSWRTPRIFRKWRAPLHEFFCSYLSPKVISY